MLFLLIDCDEHCASGCAEKKEGNCDTLCDDGYVLSAEDFKCKGRLSCYQFIFLVLFS